MTPIRTTYRRSAAVVAAVGLAVLAGCSSDDSGSNGSAYSGSSTIAPQSSQGGSAATSSSPAGSGGPSAASPSDGSPSGSASVSDDAVASAVLVAYRGYWAARVKAQAHPERPVSVEFDTYAIGSAHTDVKASVLEFRQQGIAFRGEPVLSPVVTVTRAAVNGAGGTASVVDCVDSSRWTPVFVDTGTSAMAPGQPLRVVVESTARTYGARWVIVTSVAHRGRPC